METNSVFSYFWHVDDKDQSSTTIRLYGLSEDNKNMCLKISDFTPYVYIELPPHINWNVGDNSQILGDKLDQLIGNEEHFPLVKKVYYKYRLYYANLNPDGSRKKFPYLFCSFASKNSIKLLSYKLKKPIVVRGLGSLYLKIQELDADPILQLTCYKNLPTAGWINFKGEKCNDDEKVTLCDLEYQVSYKTLSKNNDKITLAKPKIMGFDIEVNSTNITAMPKAENQGDKVFQISCVFAREGNPNDTKSYLLSLGKPDEKLVGENVIIHSFKTEAGLLEGFTKLIRKENPNIIAGYNILGFDIPYMIDRAKTDYTSFCISDFNKLGFHKFNHAKEKTIRWSSSAFKNQEFQFLDGEGRLFVDILPLIKRDYKMDNYKLKTVSEFFLKDDSKDPLSVKGIFKCYREGTKKELDGSYGKKAIKAISLVGKYCVKDSELVIKLMDVLQTWTGLCEMATTCGTSIFSLYTQGQQIKVYSQVYKYCFQNNIVVEKDGYVAKDDERYVGAHVFAPIPGIYERVLPFDFSSLYPSVIIAYNIDFSTLVNDDSVPNSKCHVMDWSDHIACLVKGSNITTDGFGIEIENLNLCYEKILSHSIETNQLEYKKQVNFFNQGKKQCVKITYEDGTNLICTPEHKIMTSDNVWIDAKDIIINKTKIKKSITFPKTIFKDYICDFNIDFGTLNLNMTNCYEVKRFAMFCRIFGMIYTDGSLSRNRATIFCGDIVDVESVINDIEFVCGKKAEYKFIDRQSSKYFKISIPFEFHNSSLWTLGDGCDGRMNRESKIPEFILNNKCPLILKREFLAGMFGGDGSPPNYSEKMKSYNTISFFKSKNNCQLENLQTFMESLQSLLLDNFNIRSYILGPYEKKDAKDCFTSSLSINVNDVILFNELIGFRYCIYKSFKLETFCSYKKLMKNVFFQRDRSFKTIKKLKETMSWDEAVKKGHEIIRKEEIILNNHYAFPNKLACIDSNRRPKNGDKITFWSSKFPSFEVYMKKLKVYHCFVDSKSDDESTIYCKNRFKINDIPCYELEVIDIQTVGEFEVFDIEVETNHSFLADGTVVHNCSHDPKVIRKKKLTDYIDSQKKIITELRDRRDKKINKFCRDEIVREINAKVEELKPYIEERSDLTKTISKNPMCAKRYYRFLKEPKGVLPTILQNLLDARKNTRTEIKRHKQEIKGLTDRDKISELEMLNNVLDKRQLAYKISANSMYGALGVKKGYLPFMTGAMAVTYMGRTNIEIVAKTIPEKYGGELVYGD